MRTERGKQILMKQKHDYDYDYDDYRRKTDYDYGFTYELAGLVERFVALLIDNLILSLLTGFVAIFTQGLLGGPAWFLVGMGYHWYYLTQNDGQTIGKRIMGVRVIKTDGSRLNTVDAIIRYLGYSVNSLIFALGWLWAFIDVNRQGWHDKLANTYVVRA